MARALRRAALILALPALVGLSTLFHWLAGSEVAGPWIMPDEAIYGVRALGLWQHGRLPIFGRSGAGYSVLYPVLAGGPLSIGSVATGYAALKPIQALVMSLAALPVYAYTRRAGLVPSLLAAALTLAAPIVLFSGYVMTEVLYYPLAAAALFCAARAVASTSYADQALALVLVAAAVATRVQGIVLVPVFAAAVLLDAALQRRSDRLRRFWPLWTLLAVGLLVVAALPGVLGAYESTVNGGYALGPALRLTFDHLAYLILVVGVVPAAALVLSFVGELRGRGDDARGRALTAITVSATLLTVPQVGVFASRYAPHLLERDLASLLPLYFAVFALWLGRGAPRPRLATSATALALLAVVVLAPWDRMVTWDAFPDSPGISLLLESPGGWRPLVAVSVVAALLLVLFRFVPAVEVAGLIVVALLAWTSVKAARMVAPYSAGAQQVLAGTPRDWIDREATGPVAYVYNGDLAGDPVVWAQRFWNRRLDRVVSLAPHDVAGPIRQVVVRRSLFGNLPFHEHLAVANDTVTLRGEAIAHQDRGPNQYGLTLWRLAPPARLATTIEGVQPNGDMTGPANVTVYGCAGGSLHLTLLPKSTTTLTIDLDRRQIVSANVTGLPSWSTAVPVPADRGPFPCLFTIHGGPLLGSTQIEFAYPS